jgi:hypothetical protein
MSHFITFWLKMYHEYFSILKTLKKYRLNWKISAIAFSNHLMQWHDFWIWISKHQFVLRMIIKKSVYKEVVVTHTFEVDEIRFYTRTICFWENPIISLLHFQITPRGQTRNKNISFILLWQTGKCGWSVWLPNIVPQNYTYTNMGTIVQL